MATIWLFLALTALSWSCYGFVDFRILTQVKIAPAGLIPQPHQASEVWQLESKSTHHPMITAIAPVLTRNEHGVHGFSWLTQYHQYSRHFQNAKGVFKRQNGVFQNDASLLATCTPCGTGISGTQTGSDTTPSRASAAYIDSVCYGSDYHGALYHISASTGLPCCASCTPVQNSTATITTGVLASPTDTDTTTITQVTSATVTVSVTGTDTTVTETVVNQTSTLPLITLSVDTITPTATNATNIPTTITGPATAIGCGTASGSGTIIGTGTVFLGAIAVTSIGTVSGFAPKVLGCGTIMATTGSFEGTATITGCGTGIGCATLTGSGVVYPHILGGFIGVTSSGTATGCGTVVGCGILTGSGTFLISGPYTTTISPPTPRSTVNIYISYCPPDPFAPFRLANNSTHTKDHKPHVNNGTSPPYPTSPRMNSTLLRAANSTANSTDFENPLCQLCPNDSGICCPLYVACGADGHCPYTALLKAGYIRHGVNVVDDGNSSTGIGMIKVEGRVAPGLPGKALREKGVVRRRAHGHGGYGHGRALGAVLGRGRL